METTNDQHLSFRIRFAIMKKKKVASMLIGMTLTLDEGPVDGQVWEWQVQYEKHHLQQLRRKGNSPIRGN
jgi:hypothetical protein